MEFLTEKFVDFESLRINGIDVQSLFLDQQWGNYFDMLNGFVYYDIVKYFWNKATIFDKFSADEEVKEMVAKDKTLKGKSRVQLGLRPYKGKEIRSNIMGINVLITQEHIAKVLGLDNEGENVNLYKVKSKHIEAIKKDLFPPGITEAEFGKAKFMKKEFNFAFKVFLASIITREGGKDTISLPHRHFIWFMHKKVKINLAELLFEYLCSTITESRHKATVVIHHPRLISEIIRQTKLIEILRTKESLRVFQTAKYDATILVNMKLIKKEDLKKPENPLKTIYETYFWCDGFPTISEHDNEEVIKNFLKMVRKETGVKVDRSMVVGVPDWDIFKGPKEVTRSRKKPMVVEQAILEEGSQNASEGQNEHSENNSVDKVIDNDADATVAEGKAAEKERRTKKRNERPSSSGDDDNVPLSAKIPIKRQKTVASKPPLKAAGISKGNVFEPNTCSNSEAQTQNQPPSSTSIDFTKPLRMIIPTPISSDSSSSSSSDGTLTDSSSETILEVIKRAPKPKPKSKPNSKISTPKEAVAEDTSFLDHLTPHLSGDAFTHSNLNSPNHPINKFLNVTVETPKKPVVQEPPIITVETPPPHSAAPELNNPNTINTSEPEKQTPQNVEMPQSKPHTPPPSDQCDDIPSDNQDHHISTSSTPSETLDNTLPSSTLSYGPNYKPLTIDELNLPTDFALPILEDLLKAEINVDDDIITTSKNPFDEIRKIKIIPLKRKRPEPTIPFNRNQPFFNPNSEPNLELLDNAISISLKKFKGMEEEVLIFPSDIDAKVRELENEFRQSLRLLGGYVKRKIQGRGMNALSQIMEVAERSHAPRLTFFNHEEELQRLEFQAAVNESIRRSLEAAKRLTAKEIHYVSRVSDAEQARIAAEAEIKRLAEQEALRILVERATRIAKVETQKLREAQEMGPHSGEDTIMLDQNLDEQASDKGKHTVVDTTPPSSPVRTFRDSGSPSCAIPPAVQLALDEMKSEMKNELSEIKEDMKNEMDELRADMRTGMNASTAATNKKLDEMMDFLKSLASQMKKP
ncbi:NADH:ubiquinone reductase (H(+)-translocating) [Trifolium repens]|nr:NADH:ubiquinone reductase (H(+)-translocating) [Trifolium repens]